MFPRIENCRGSNSSCPLSLKNVKAVTLNVRGIALKNGRKFPISYARKLEEAEMVFEMMSREYDFIPNLEHYVCMIITSGSAGNFDKAVAVIRSMPSLDYCVVWLALLGACRKWGNIKLGILAFNQLLQLDSTCDAAYALTAHTFAVARMEKDAERIGAAMRY